MVNGLPSLKDPIKLCIECLTDKQHKDSILRRVYGKQQTRYNLCKQIYASILNQNQIATRGTSYVLLMISPVKRRFSSYMKNMRILQCIEILKLVLKMRLVHILIASFRTDQGGEFNSNEIEEFCKDQGISSLLTAT